MKASKIEKLEALKQSLQDTLSEIESTCMGVDEDSLKNMVEAVDEVEARVKEAKAIVVSIRKL